MPVIRKTKVEFEGRIEEREVIVEEERVEPWDGAAQLRLVGKPVSRVDGAARVTGQAIYTSDVQLPRMLIGRILRSPHPHARLITVDSARAEAMAGVWLVWHRDQLPPVPDLSGKPLFPDELTHEGDVVAFVVADDERVVDDALSAIEVAYQNLPFVVGLAAARAENAPSALAHSTVHSLSLGHGFCSCLALN